MLKISYEVKKSIVINKQISDVYDFMSNFNNWNLWSPWLCLEPETKTVVSGQPKTVGHKHFWEGKMIGSGDMTLVDLSDKKFIKIKLQFYKPWKAQSDVCFTLEPEWGSTKVTWEMNATLPFFMFFFKKMMAGFIGNDFNRGLSMLKQYLETGKIESQTSVKGNKKRSGFYAVGIKTKSLVENLSQDMTVDFGKLHQYIQEGKLPKPDFMLDFTHEFDMVNGVMTYTAAVGYNKKIVLPSDLKLNVISVGDHEALEVLHVGSYQNLGNAWSTAMAIQRYKKLKKSKNIPPYEVYLNNPQQTLSKDLQTLIVIPLK